jgi:hypothetical protein
MTVVGITDPTGYTTDFWNSQNQVASKYTLSGATVGSVLSKISVYMQDRASGNEPVVAVWRDTAGAPGALVGYGSIPTVTATGWYDTPSVTLVDAAGVMNDGVYWIGFFVPVGANLKYIYQVASGNTDYRIAVVGGPTNPFGAVTPLTYQVAINATATAPAVDWTKTHLGPYSFPSNGNIPLNWRGVQYDAGAWIGCRVSPVTGKAVYRSAKDEATLDALIATYDASPT